MTVYQLDPNLSFLTADTPFVSALCLAKASETFLEKDLFFFENWIAEQKHGDMTFLEKNMAARRNAELILPGVKSAITFLFPYATGKHVRHAEKKSVSNQEKPHQDSLIGRRLISKYIYGKDYHTAIKKKLNAYGEKLKTHFNDSDLAFRAVTDSIPFLDRAHARASGLGFVGKNTMLIRPGLGSFFFIATLLTNVPIEKISALSLKKNPLFSLDCGSCRKCLDACPTQAFDEQYKLDAKKCLSYLSIEHRDLVPDSFLPHFKNTVYGCDVCQEVCPYNLVTTDFPMIKAFSNAHAPFVSTTVLQIARMTEIQYEQWFGGTAATRAKYAGWIRNALYHLHAVDDSNLDLILASLQNSKHALIQKTVHQLKLLRKGNLRPDD